MAIVACVLLDHVGKNVPERESLVAVAPGEIEGSGAVCNGTGPCALLTPDPEGPVAIGGGNVESPEAARLPYGGSLLSSFST
jgi:hypothetical protein